MPVKLCKPKQEPASCLSLLVFSLLCMQPVLAEDTPSMDFLEYLGTEENEIDGELSGPVDLDLEQYIVANNPELNNDKQDVKSEVNEHD